MSALHITSRRRRVLAAILGSACLFSSAIAAAAPQLGASPHSAARPVAPTAIAQSCTATPNRAAACRLVTGFFEHAVAGRYAASCEALGTQLLYESGGATCPSRLSSAYFAEPKSWAVIGVHPAAGGLGVLVRLALPELGQLRWTTWLATVAVELGNRRIVRTQLVG